VKTSPRLNEKRTNTSPSENGEGGHKGQPKVKIKKHTQQTTARESGEGKGGGGEWPREPKAGRDMAAIHARGGRETQGGKAAPVHQGGRERGANRRVQHKETTVTSPVQERGGRPN
jgi:hypothetical protein